MVTVVEPPATSSAAHVSVFPPDAALAVIRDHVPPAPLIDDTVRVVAFVVTVATRASPARGAVPSVTASVVDAVDWAPASWTWVSPGVVWELVAVCALQLPAPSQALTRLRDHAAPR